jgi:hypothetical protein
MATVVADPDRALTSGLSVLSRISGVVSVHARWIENVFNVWIGVRDDDDESRSLVYDFEGSFLDRFQDLSIDFHVVSVPDGRKLDDYISDATAVFKRIA